GLSGIELERTQRSGPNVARGHEKLDRGWGHGWPAGGLQRKRARGRVARPRFHGRNRLLQDQTQHEKWGHSLLLSGYGFLSRAESGDSDNHPRRPPGIRALLRRLREIGRAHVELQSPD